ncbi:Gfo/Idh/MocA family oxidoreductase [Candidatus Latescibacterota bacterium]
MPEKSHRESRDILRIGWVGLGPFSFYGGYITTINSILHDYYFLNMRVTHIWADDYAKNYKGSAEFVGKNVEYWTTGPNSMATRAKEFGIPNICENYTDMVDEVDAAMIMDFDRAYELAEPFIRRGLPVFLCSPVAVSVPECERILDLAEAHGSAVYSGSFTVDMQENLIRNHKVKRDNIAAFFSSTSHQFFTSYANDGLEPIHRLIGNGVRRVTLTGWDGSQGYDPDRIPVSRIHLEYYPRGEYPPIQGVLTLGGFKRETNWFKVYYHDHSLLEGTANRGARELVHRDFLINIQEVFATNKSLETREDILHKQKVVVAAYKSANEGNRPVDIDEVGDYRLPTVRIEKWDEIPE